MSFWDSIGNAFKDAANAVANAGEAVGDKIAAATVSGANLFVGGWKDVFNGNFQQGFFEVGLGMAKCVGIPMPPGISGDTYADIVGQAAQWSLQQYQTSGQPLCFSAYEDEVRQNLSNNHIPWTDSMDGPLRAGATQMSWINMSC
ncbi:MAG: hypothetical protein Q8M57_01695 [Nitrosomonas sp.]|uniref:hypothetical protein n=1 Tax=Nitrosomonas sp. TaxID=42353 RepID=UPI002735E44E|nr:hypothetical protein [Nitrosomonas sp.]MDP3279767.1 hypothetical protein [Nitrosomonas sp.]